jgi:hypothetical protein
MFSNTTTTDWQENLRDKGASLALLPLRSDLRLGYLSSLIIVVITAIASLAGILAPEEFYPTAEIQQSSVPNDVVTLIIGLPILLGSMWLTRRGKLVGLLFWPGALFYSLYNYLVYLLAMPLTIMYPAYLAIVILSIYTIMGVVASIDGEAVKARLSGRVPERLSGGLLIGLAVLIMTLAASIMAKGIGGESPVSRHELSLATTDVVVSTAWAIGGFLLWRRRALGYLGGMGLLFQGSMLFIGAILTLLLQPLFTDAPLAVVDVVVLILMGLVCFVPFGIFVRGVIRS